MSGREKGKKLFADLASQAKAKVQPSGEPVLHARGQQTIHELAEDLSGPDGMPGLRVFRDSADRIRLQRPARNGEIAITWQRPIGALVVQTFRGDKSDPEVRYLYREDEDEWHRMSGIGELYEDVSKALVALLYPELKQQ